MSALISLSENERYVTLKCGCGAETARREIRTTFFAEAPDMPERNGWTQEIVWCENCGHEFDPRDELPLPGNEGWKQ